MCPYLWRHGGLTLSSYAFFYGLGVAAAGLIFVLLLARRGYGLRRPTGLFLLTAIMIVIGARILYGAVRWSEAASDLHEFFDLSAGGQILYGSVLLTLPTLWLFSGMFHMRRSTVFDAAAVGTPLGMAIGRIGCLCAGCCHGTVTDLPWGIAYPKIISTDGDIVGTPAYMAHLQKGLIPFTADHSLPVHPVPVYETLAMSIVFVVLIQLWKRGRLMGQLAPLFVLAYGTVRFALEFVRVQETVLYGLTLAQILSLGIGGAAILGLIVNQKALASLRQSDGGLSAPNRP